MKLTFLKVSTFALTLVLSSNTMIAQKSNVVSAAVEYGNFDKALMFQQDAEAAKRILLKSKSYIDPAMEHDATKDDAKAHYYNAVIHFGLMMMSGMEPDNPEMQQFQNEQTREMVEKSFKIAHKDKKFKRDVDDFINKWVGLLNSQALAAFEANEFELAFVAFAGAYSMKQMIDIEDADLLTNSIVSAKNALAVMKKDDKTEEALAFVETAFEVLPDNVDMAIEGVNLALAIKDYDKADRFFDAAAKANSEDKTLFASMGRIYLTNADEKKKELLAMDIYNPDYALVSEKVTALYGKSEKYLLRAMEIDPKYADAAYDLGVLYLGQGETLKERVKTMDYDDPNRDKLEKESEDLYAKAAGPLEIYFNAEPNADVARVLFQVYYNAGNTEKAMEFKRKAEELSN
jgi:tetratricopeptide (TPR) repeat protein